MKLNHSKSEGSSSHNDELAVIQHGERCGVSRIYKLYRGQFISYAMKNFRVSEAEAIDIYQDSFIALHQNVQSGRLSNLSVSLRSYLFQIGKYKILNLLRRSDRHSFEMMDEKAFHDECDSPDWVLKQEITYRAVLAMQEPCSTVLSLYYWEQKSMSEIASAMNYKSDQIAKNRKSLCLKKLKEDLIQKFNTEGLTVKIDADGEK